MIEEKILRYKEDMSLAKKLSKTSYTDKEYYESMVLKMEKILRFYEKLRLWNESNKN